MKIIINDDVVLDVTDGEVQLAAELITALQKSKMVPTPERVAAYRKKARPFADLVAEGLSRPYPETSLTPIQRETLAYLREADSPVGVHLSAFVEHFGITLGAADSRLVQLKRYGLAAKVSAGHYRATDPATGLI